MNGPDGVAEASEDLLPVRMLNEYAYCPRLFHLMYVEGRWDDNVYTVEGKHAHRRVDQLDHVLPDPDASENERPASSRPTDDDEPPQVSRSVPLASERLGLTAKLDLVSTAGSDAVPVETKRGRVPKNPERSWEPERVQLMAQGLLLREHGYQCDHGVLYFTGSRSRVDVPFTAELEARTLWFVEQARLAAHREELPPPLEDSPKCFGCSLNGICLPDETLALQSVPEDPVAPGVRRLYPARDDALPLYVQEQGAKVGKSGENLVVRKGTETLATARLKDVSQLVLCGNVGVSAQTIHLLAEAAVPLVHLSSGLWFYAITYGISLRNAYDRAAQFAVASQPMRCLGFAKEIVSAKGLNQRTMLRRNGSASDRTLGEMSQLISKVGGAEGAAQLLGLEGGIAAHYYRHFGSMLSPRDFDAEWDFERRNRRPPRDPINALLSFGYALLTKECTVALLAEGLDPWWGFYHRPRHGRPALALDLMEPFRPLIVDSAVVTAVNTGMVKAKDFTTSHAGCMLNAVARKSLIRAYESRMDQLVTHPLFDYRCSWRSMIRVHARLLSRWLRGDVPRYESIVTR
jgi:CRISP-associated protein Cas1